MMECNKEEAIRAKEIAEAKMQNKDYSGARRVALKAQQLYPVLDNISQLISVCDVHLSAESTDNGNEKDWYGILKVESTADEASIKKQYKNFALLLHPDKNRFAGASDAFKLIGEARRNLLDPVLRRMYDAKTKSRKPVPPKQQANKRTPTPKTQPQARSPSVGKTNAPFTSSATSQQQPPNPNPRTFWTMCPFCAVKYEYYRDVINKNFLCQRCKKSFVGYEIKPQATANHTPSTRPNSGVFKTNGNGKEGTKSNVTFVPRKKESVLKTGASEVGGDSKATPNSSAKVTGKRKRQSKKSSVKPESDSKKRQTKKSSVRFDFDGSRSKPNKEDTVQENGDVEMEQNVGPCDENLRRSGRSKTNISYNENLSCDGLGSPSKKVKLNGSSQETEKGNDGSTANGNTEKTSAEANNGIAPDSSPDGPTVLEYPEPEFNDFDKLRREDCFTEGQVWAAYDPLDAMPRYYARIIKVISSAKFKLKITWLEPDPDDEDELKWVDAELPVSCGKLKSGSSITTTDRLMFSHSIDWEKGSTRDTFKIYPRKEETWALFKDWDMKWHSDVEAKRKYEYEFVEILSDYSEDNGVSVAYLGKVKGYSSVFCRTAMGGVDPFQIPRNQLFRFSHRVPSFHLTFPRNSLELDPACYPTNLVEIDVPKDPKMEAETVEVSDESCPLSETGNKIEPDSDGNSSSSEESIEACEIPDQDFFNFDGEKSPEKFQPGQLWAMYSDEDGLPKYYALIKKVDHQPKFQIHITWLESKNTIKFADKLFPIGCGIFKISKGKTLKYAATSFFSHRLETGPTNNKGVYAIYPRKAEVWALYKNWSLTMTRSDLENCEYDIVEVLEENNFVFKVVVLEKVSGHNSVFKVGRNNGGSAAFSVEIARTELLRFSHQIPAFRLTDEREGRLRGCVELDLAALPIGMIVRVDRG